MDGDLNLSSLEQLKAVSVEMCEFAEQGDWAAVLVSDHKRLQILQKQANGNIDGESPQARKHFITEILDLDEKIKELAGTERKIVRDKGIRLQAQVAAQTSYKKALAPDTGL